MRALLFLGLLVGVTSAVPHGVAAAAGDPDGRYRGDLADEDGVRYGTVTFQVAKDGRVIRDFSTATLAVCVNPNAIGGIEVIEVPFSADRVPVKRSGRFAKTFTVAADAVFADPPSDGELEYRLSGRLRDGRVRDGRIVLEGLCASDETFTARRLARAGSASWTLRPRR